jgi:hypothetical protein
MPDHAERYSPYGVGFEKARLFAAGGGPAIYLRWDLHKKQQEFRHSTKEDWHGFDPSVYSFVTPFSPKYAPAKYKEKHWEGKPECNFTSEREWRVPHDFTFQYSQVRFVILPGYEDMDRFPKDLKDAIGRDRFIMMDVYKQIEKLWPVHII